MKKSFGAKTLIYPTPVWLIRTSDKHVKIMDRKYNPIIVLDSIWAKLLPLVKI
jgi:hypothetical protein